MQLQRTGYIQNIFEQKVAMMELVPPLSDPLPIIEIMERIYIRAAFGVGVFKPVRK